MTIDDRTAAMGMNENGAAAEGPAGDYDLLPYPSLPYAHTQPARLAAIGDVHGIKTPAAESARVLELGCASAGNIIPLAARFPRARFFGVDLARRHIDDARRRISELGLKNIEVSQGDLMQFAPGAGQFDYVLCHGVFSWVPRLAQDAILRICAETLAKGGIAVISYNVLPGWHLRNVIRDLCLRHAGAEGSPQQRVAKARALLADLAASNDAANPYGMLLRKEAQRTAHRPASYILGEFLVADNWPCHFQDFVERARQCDLAYVCEAGLDAAVPEIRGAAIAAKLRAADGDRLAKEQYIDDLTGRTFRCSVLTKASVGGAPAFNPANLRGLHIASTLRLDPNQGDGDVSAYTDGRGRTNASKHPAVSRALSRLASAYPETLSVDQLTAPEASDDVTEAAQSAVRIRKALSELCRAGHADIWTTPLRVGRAASARPMVWPIAREEAATGQPWVTNLAHAPVALKPAMAVLMPHLDGAHDRGGLKQIMIGALERGELRAPEMGPGLEIGQDEALEAVAARYVERVLDHLAVNALLAPAEAPT